jgi:hypothetical protein
MCGGFVGDILDGVGDLIEGVADVVGDVVEGVVDVVSDIGSGIDDFVHDVIPGGWAGVAGGALLAIGIYNPALLGLAEGGALTTEALTAAGLDAAAVAEGVAAVAPEVLAATETAIVSGISPELIAMANATADPIAALNAAAGWTTADTAYLATIGATPELLAIAETNNAALAATEAGTTTTTAAEGTTTTTAADGTTTAADGSTTQVFDDGSTLTTNADGTITSVDTSGVSQTTQIFDDGSSLTTNANGDVVSTTNATDTGLTGGTGGSTVPVEDAVSVPGAGAGTPDPTLLQGAGNLASAVVDTLGPLGTAAVLGGGATLLNSALTGGTATGGPDNRTVSYEWGKGTPLESGPLNPGLLQQTASQPFYKSTNPTDAQFYWGAHNVVNKPEDIANYNNIPTAPATPWGAGKTAVGGQASFNPTQFVNQYITNPAYAGVNSGVGPGYMGAIAPTQPEPMPVPMSMAQQAIAARTNNSGAPTAQLATGPAVPA